MSILRGITFWGIGLLMMLNHTAFAQAFILNSANLSSSPSMPQAHTLSASYGFGCDGGNISPELNWENPPHGTKSFVLTMYDQDAPTGIGWMHWVVVNIPSDVKAIEQGASSDLTLWPALALQTRTDFGTPGYGGSCPPEGEMHRYIFTLTALDVEHLDIDANAMPALVGFFTRKHSLGSATLIVADER